MRFKLLSLLWSLLLVLPFFSLAQSSSQFVVGVLAGDDDEPPTAPVLLQAEPVAFDQINLLWNASTDNVLLGGYVVVRDGNPIATTTLTNFFDTGLIPLTLYTYEVYAFDWVNNVSSSSAPLATTTLALPPPAPTSTPPSRAVRSRTVQLSDWQIDTTFTAATLTFASDRPTRYLLRWGRADTYNLGYLENQVFLTNHRTQITDLEPGTTYVYELILFTPGGISEVVRRDSFTTKAPPVLATPVNVSRLRADVTGSDVTLSYQLPSSEVARVRIVRSHLFYPTDMYDGAVVYEGLAGSFVDVGALRDRSPQYYAVFSIMSDGAVSSGALARVERRAEVGTEETIVAPLEPVEELVPLDFRFDRSDIKLRQLGREQTFGLSEVVIDPTEPVVVRVERAAVTTNLKAIIVSVFDPSNQRIIYTFLLKLNPDGTAYEATIPPLRLSGETRFRLEIYDFEAAVVARYQVPVSLVPLGLAAQPVFFPDALIRPLWSVGVLALATSLPIMFIWFYRRRTEDKQDEAK